MVWTVFYDPESLHSPPPLHPSGQEVQKALGNFRITIGINIIFIAKVVQIYFKNIDKKKRAKKKYR